MAARERREQEARVHFTRAIEVGRRVGLISLEGQILRSFGLIAFLEGDYPSASRNFAEAESLLSRIERYEPLAELAAYRGAMACAQGQDEEAAAFALKAIELFEKVSNKVQKGLALVQLGLASRATPDKSNEHISQGFEMAISNTFATDLAIPGTIALREALLSKCPLEAKFHWANVKKAWTSCHRHDLIEYWKRASRYVE
jgi:tetratricopeptide (TPR) repeat protein